MEEVENLSYLALNGLKNEVLDAINENEHIIEKLEHNRQSVYMLLSEINAYKYVLDLIDKRIQRIKNLKKLTETNVKASYVYKFKDKNDCVSYEWK